MYPVPAFDISTFSTRFPPFEVAIKVAAVEENPLLTNFVAESIRIARRRESILTASIFFPSDHQSSPFRVRKYDFEPLWISIFSGLLSAKSNSLDRKSVV